MIFFPESTEPILSRGRLAGLFSTGGGAVRRSNGGRDGGGAGRFRACLEMGAGKLGPAGWGAFLAKWRLRCRGVADSLEEAGERLFTFLRYPPRQWKTGAKTVALGAPAIELLHGLPRVDDNPYVFPGTKERAHLERFNGVVSVASLTLKSWCVNYGPQTNSVSKRIAPAVSHSNPRRIRELFQQ